MAPPRTVLGVSTRDLRAWSFVAAGLGCHYLYTRSAGASPFWNEDAKALMFALSALTKPPRPPLLLFMLGWVTLVALCVLMAAEVAIAIRSAVQRSLERSLAASSRGREAAVEDLAAAYPPHPPPAAERAAPRGPSPAAAAAAAPDQRAAARAAAEQRAGAEGAAAAAAAAPAEAVGVPRQRRGGGPAASEEDVREARLAAMGAAQGSSGGGGGFPDARERERVAAAAKRRLEEMRALDAAARDAEARGRDWLARHAGGAGGPAARDAAERLDADRALRAGQDEDYAASLAADAARAAARADAERRREEEKAAAASRRAAAAELKARLRGALPPEPAEGEEGSVAVRVRLPSGGAAERRWAGGADVGAVTDWVQSLEELPLSWEPGTWCLSTSLPRVLLRDREQAIADAGGGARHLALYVVQL